MIILQKETSKNIILNWPEILDHLYRVLIVEGSGFGKKNTLLNLTNHEPDINKIYLYAKDPYEAKYKLLTTKEKVQPSNI